MKPHAQFIVIAVGLLHNRMVCLQKTYDFKHTKAFDKTVT